uniref:Tat pathway signal protein n=2 Tax=Prevotella heparinolytica TaxID=28113 RepID=UPI0035A0B6AF
SHPEIAITNAWSIDKLKTELVKIRQLGLEPIPKLNFATSHDTWLGEYHRMVSTRKYYAVCSDLISEVIELFDTPRFFHIGMDEEDYKNQVQYRYATVRQGDLWWKDFYFFVDQVEKKGVRPWIWSDYGWHYPDVFFKKMPKSVLQSNWYYDVQFGDLTGLEESHKTRYNMYYELEKHGYDQVPTGSNFNNNLNMEGTVRHFKNVIDPSRLLGFMSAPWLPTMPQCAASHKEAIEQLGRAKNEFMSK